MPEISVDTHGRAYLTSHNFHLQNSYQQPVAICLRFKNFNHHK